MSDLAEMPRVIVVTDETTLEDLAETIAILNAEAKALSRRGKSYDQAPEWKLQHARIDAVLEDWLAKAHASA